MHINIIMADSAFDIGSIFGIDIQLHWTFLLLLLIAAFTGILLPVIILFVFVVLHELAHSVTSRRNGIAVKKILLLPIGGASIIDLEDANPDVSFRIALAGPLSSIFMGLGFGLIDIFLPAGGWKQIFQIFFLLNIILGVFNLLPAFPLDGGRVLKSWLEKKYDQYKATEIAVNVSKAIIFLFIAGSVIYLIQTPGGLFNSNSLFVVVWDLIVVLFVYSGAQGELEMSYIIKYTANLRVSQAISSNYAMVAPATKMRKVYEVLLKKGTHIILFQKGGKTYAVSKISVSPLSKETASILDSDVSAYASELPEIGYSAPLSKAIEKMRYEDATVLAVMKGKRLAGILYAPHVESVVALHLPTNPK